MRQNSCLREAGNPLAHGLDFGFGSRKSMNAWFWTVEYGTRAVWEPATISDSTTQDANNSKVR